MNAEEQTQALCLAVRTLADLLEGFPHARLVEALDSGNTGSTIEMALKRRQKWGQVFQEIAADLEKQWQYLSKNKGEAIECLALARRGIDVFNGKEFKDAIVNLNMFVDLCLKLEAIMEKGTLRHVLDTINRP